MQESYDSQDNRKQKMIFSPLDYYQLSNIVFALDPDGKPLYPGYVPEKEESPNGDGYFDDMKKYAHIAVKYLKHPDNRLDGQTLELLAEYLQKAFQSALAMAIELGVPKAFWPEFEHGALRVLEYEPGAISHPHTDFDLFTISCYRNILDDFVYTEGLKHDPELQAANCLSPLIHFGELLQMVVPEYTATRHEVVREESRYQYSLVYFAMPNPTTILIPDTKQTVGEWLEERLERSRRINA